MLKSQRARDHNILRELSVQSLYPTCMAFRMRSDHDYCVPQGPAHHDTPCEQGHSRWSAGIEQGKSCSTYRNYLLVVCVPAVLPSHFYLRPKGIKELWLLAPVWKELTLPVHSMLFLWAFQGRHCFLPSQMMEKAIFCQSKSTCWHIVFALHHLLKQTNPSPLWWRRGGWEIKNNNKCSRICSIQADHRCTGYRVAQMLQFIFNKTPTICDPICKKCFIKKSAFLQFHNI